jgi:hypothetical protein
VLYVSVPFISVLIGEFIKNAVAIIGLSSVFIIHLRKTSDSFLQSIIILGYSGKKALIIGLKRS